MEEIALVFSSLAGACTAVALDKIPRIPRNKQISTINPAITNQLHSLRMEKEILSKTITRIHQQEFDGARIQKEKLLLRYQHQLGIIIAKIEKLETTSYTEFGSVGDNLITLMDNRLSQLDQRLHEISSKITVTQTKKVAERSTETILENIQTKKIEPQTESQKEKIEAVKEKIETVGERTVEYLPPIEVPTYEIHETVEPGTIETIDRITQVPIEFTRSTQVEPQIPQKMIESIIIEEPVPVSQSIIQNVKEETTVKLPKPELIQQEPEKKIQLPTAIKIPEEDKLDDDDKDLDKIKSEIMKALSKLEQVEVE